VKQIKTAAQLEALPTRSVVVDADDDAWQLREVRLPDGTPSTFWYCTTDGVQSDAWGVFVDYSPLLLVWTPPSAAPAPHDPADCATCDDHADATTQADRDDRIGGGQ